MNKLINLSSSSITDPSSLQKGRVQHLFKHSNVKRSPRPRGVPPVPHQKLQQRHRTLPRRRPRRRAPRALGLYPKQPHHLTMRLRHQALLQRPSPDDGPGQLQPPQRVLHRLGRDVLSAAASRVEAARAGVPPSGRDSRGEQLGSAI